MPGEEDRNRIGGADHHEEVGLLLCHGGWEESILHLDDSLEQPFHVHF